MKKVSAMILCVALVLAMIAVPAMAAQTVTFTVTSSANEVKHGDVIVVTVNMSKVEKAYNGAFVFDFDTNVFEYLEEYDDPASGDTLYSEADVNGATAGVSVASGKVSGWFMNGKKNVEGDIFFVLLKVKNTAPAGATQITSKNYQVETQADGVLTASVKGTTVTVVCDHSYSGWEKNNADTHKQTCSKCGDVKTEAHKWNKGEDTTPAGCATAGVKTFTCTVCSETKTETIKPTGKHTYGAWEKNNADTHKQTCACGDVKTETHKWDKGEVTKEPDCKNDGVKTFTCTVCSETKTTVLPATGAHGYDSWTKVDDVNHTAVCTGCGGAAKTEKHTMNAGEITKPATCKETGIKTFTCTAKGCGHTTTEVIPVTEDHNFGEWTAADAENHKRVCSICEKAETEAHKAGTELKTDAENHWSECACGQKMGVTAHVYDHMVGDAEGHAEGCVCGVLKSGAAKAPHTFDEGVVTLKPTNKKEGEKTFTCTACQFKKIEKIDKVTTPNTGDNTLVIPMVILAVLSACGLAVTVVARKRASR